MSRVLVLLAGLAVLAASLPAHAVNPQPEPPAKTKMRPLSPYFGGPQPDPPARKLRRGRVGFEPPAAP